jgi:hypothetical protein
MAGAALAFIGQVLVIAAVALALPSTDYGFMVSPGNLTQLLAASTLAGAVGALLGAGLGAVIRNLGGAVTTVVLVLFVIPPLGVQLFSDTVSWIPTTLFTVISGVTAEISVWAALAALTAWALVPAAAGVMTVQRRDVV